MSKYRVIAVDRTTLEQRVCVFDGAPNEQRIARWLSRKQHIRQFVATRYYPSRKGWLLLDYQNALVAHVGGSGRTLFRGIIRSERSLPSEDAAVMTIIHRLTAQRVAS